MRLFLLTTLTMIAFAGNSVLARLALSDRTLDASSFTSLRIFFGAATLGLLVWRRTRTKPPVKAGSWWSATALFVYAAGFSFAYLALDTGMGALILFVCVQATMISWALVQGDRPSVTELWGLVIALIAFTALVSPGLTAPDPTGAALMVAAGVGWGVYSLRGKAATHPLAATAGNFARALPLTILLVAVLWATAPAPTLTARGIALAFASGAITSGLGYALWYRCLRDLTATRAAIVQLTVPVIAAFGGVVFSNETISSRLVFCSLAILGGIALAILGKSHRTQSA